MKDGWCPRAVDKEQIDRWFERTVAGLTPEQAADLKRKFSSASRLNEAEQTNRRHRVRCEHPLRAHLERDRLQGSTRSPEQTDRVALPPVSGRNRTGLLGEC